MNVLHAFTWFYWLLRMFWMGYDQQIIRSIMISPAKLGISWDFINQEMVFLD